MEKQTTTLATSERYFEKPKRLKTWSGIPLKGTYTPEDISHLDHARDIGEPGAFPFTRGIHRDMYRGRLWSIREICGYDSPQATNERLRRLIAEGESALNVINDAPTYCALDSDHPLAEGNVGLMGVPLCSLRDTEIMMQGIPIDQVSMTLSVYVPPVLLLYLGAAEKQGVPLSQVRGTMLNDALSQSLVRYFGPALPQDLGVRLVADSLIYCNENVPLFYPLSVGSEGLRESGATAAQEIAFDFCIVRHYLKEVARRGGNIDEIARRVSFTHRCGIDIFEEAAKFRAARRLWASIMSDELGAEDPRALTYKVHAVTKGSDLFPQQPECNIVRIAYQALGAVLGGVQSMHTTSYDEPICLPTEKSALLALRTQQVLAYETGVVNVADPLGGSYYVEHLTDQLYQEMRQIVDEWKEDIAEAIESERLMNLLQRQAYQFQCEVEAKERLVVGVNAFIVEEEEKQEQGELHKPSWEAIKQHVENVKDLRRSRDVKKVRKTVEALRKVAEKKEENLIPAAMEAVRNYATLGEIMGAIRLAYGYTYDCFDELQYPF
ncbi:MAG: methylmalonyl-CoA mutase family protein [Dehalococcoidia bacterium]